MKTDKELADELDARKRLEGHGYKRRVCVSCRGTGVILGSTTGNHHCYHCGGKGYSWEAPLIRAFREARESITLESIQEARDAVDRAMECTAERIKNMNKALEGAR